MGMVSGRFIVKNDIDLNNATEVQQELNQAQASPNHSCGGSCGGSSCGAASGGACGCGG
jgi:uncharacterized membrane protein